MASRLRILPRSVLVLARRNPAPHLLQVQNFRAPRIDITGMLSCPPNKEGFFVGLFGIADATYESRIRGGYADRRTRSCRGMRAKFEFGGNPGHQQNDGRNGRRVTSVTDHN